MVKLTFVVGGGKLVRQKYTDDLPKIFMASLTAIGYKDDISAACEVASAGKFKFQHDTGKNLKFVHVFPHISAPSAAAADEEEGEEEALPKTPEDLLLTCNMDMFKQLIARQLETYGQKKKLMDLLKARISKLEEIEAKMTKLEQLSSEEQALFDGIGVEELKEKGKVVSTELQAMADAGQLTSAERAGLEEQLTSRLAAAKVEHEKAEAEGKPKKAQALQHQIDTLQNTQKALKDNAPVGLPPLRHAQDIKKLYGKLNDVKRIEKASKGNYTVDELRRIGEKPEIEEAIAELERRSRGWLESDEVFEARLQACVRAAATAKRAPGPPTGGGYSAAASRPSSSASGGFTTVKGGGRTAKAKGAPPTTRNQFSALG